MKKFFRKFFFWDEPSAGAEGVKNYRFLFPGIWYLAAYNCNYMLNQQPMTCGHC